MIDLFKSGVKETADLPADFKNPFLRDNIDTISMRIWKGYGGQTRVTGHVEFVHDNTRGKQDFEAETFEQLIVKMKTFLEAI